MIWSVIFTMAIAGCLQGFVNGQTACSTIEDSLQSSVLTLGTFSNINQSVTGNNAANLLALFTSTKFKCYGSIQSWSGIIHFDTGSDNLTNYTTPLMHLQVWRPHKEKSYFRLVGSSPLMQHSVLRNDTVVSGKFYHDFTISLRGNTTGNEEENGVIYFQPEDVLGCYIPVSDNSPGFDFWNFTGEDEVGMNLLMFSSTTRLKCEVSVYDASMSMVKSVLPQIIPHYVVGDIDERSGKAVSMCSDEFVTVHKETTSCNDCSSDEPSSGKVVPGLLVIVAVCLVIICFVGITSNLIIICCARCKMRKRQHLEKKRNSNSSLCDFIVNTEVQTELPSNIRSLADFLQYSMQNKSTTESFNVTWV